VPFGHVLFGFFGAPVSRTGSHHRRSDTARFCSQRRGSFASPEKRAWRQRFSPRHLRTPCTAARAAGLAPKKPSPDRGKAQATTTGPGQGAYTRQGKDCRCCSRGRGGFFWPKAPRTHQLCEGCGGGRAMTAAEGAVLSACSEPVTRRSRSEAKAQPVSVFVRCERGLVTGTKVPLVKRSTGKTRSSTCAKRHGRRPAYKTKNNQRQRAGRSSEPFNNDYIGATGSVRFDPGHSLNTRKI